jgi:mycothiol synthase
MALRIRVTKRVEVRVASPLSVALLPPPQLELELKTGAAVTIPQVTEPYILRTFQVSDTEKLSRLLSRAGFAFSSDSVWEALATCLPGGCFVIESERTGALVSTMMARHFASARYRFGGRIDWLATDPDHRGRGLARITASAAVRRLQDAGYQNIWVTTDDHRIGALKTFLSLGFVPAVSVETQDRWRMVLESLRSQVE